MYDNYNGFGNKTQNMQGVPKNNRPRYIVDSEDNTRKTIEKWQKFKISVLAVSVIQVSLLHTHSNSSTLKRRFICIVSIFCILYKKNVRYTNFY